LLPIGVGLVFVMLFSTFVIVIIRRRRTETPRTSRDTRRSTNQGRSIGLRRRSDQALIEATLIPSISNMPTISLIGMDLVLGRDPSISAAHLDDPSVNSLHARLIRLASGDYLLKDQNSVAGTWVNYHQVPERGTILRHGDVIHLGRIEYQFQLRNPPLESRIHVESIKSLSSEFKKDNHGTEESAP
jgi:pSer/pThr/pTyr-binding forkhead associated (FHA) protein